MLDALKAHIPTEVWRTRVDTGSNRDGIVTETCLAAENYVIMMILEYDLKEETMGCDKHNMWNYFNYITLFKKTCNNKYINILWMCRELAKHVQREARTCEYLLGFLFVIHRIFNNH